jgi:threonine aldolase
MKGDSIIIGDKAHIMNYERGGMATFGSIMPTVLPNQPDGTLDLTKLASSIPTFNDPHCAAVTCVALESSMNNCHGMVLRPDYLAQVKKITKKNKIRLHLDGARVWNAAVALDMSMKDYCKDFNTVAVCMSKGMGAPVGSLLVGSHTDIARAKTLRKIAGGSMR